MCGKQCGNYVILNVIFLLKILLEDITYISTRYQHKKTDKPEENFYTGQGIPSFSTVSTLPTTTISTNIKHSMKSIGVQSRKEYQI